MPDLVDAAALAELERIAATADLAPPPPARVAVEPPPRIEPLPPPTPRLVPLVTIVGPDGAPQTCIDLGALDARLAVIERVVRHLQLLVMVLADRMNITGEEYDGARAAVRKAEGGKP